MNRRAARGPAARPAAGWALGGLVWMTAATAHASEPAQPFALSAHIDLPIIATGLAIGGAPSIFANELQGPSCASPCDPTQIRFDLDRYVVGHHSAEARIWSDRLLTLEIAAPFALVLADGALRSWDGGRLDGAWVDATLLLETASVNLALNTLVKHAVHRPRPLAYDRDVDKEVREAPDAGLSFYSGHSATAFAMATATSSIFAARHPDSDWVIPLWIVSESLAATTAGLRVAAGKHFWTDVVTGAVVGASVGYLVPALHRTSTADASQSPAEDRALRLTPLPTPQGAGLVVSWQ